MIDFPEELGSKALVSVREYCKREFGRAWAKDMKGRGLDIADDRAAARDLSAAWLYLMGEQEKCSIAALAVINDWLARLRSGELRIFAAPKLWFASSEANWIESIDWSRSKVTIRGKDHHVIFVLKREADGFFDDVHSWQCDRSEKPVAPLTAAAGIQAIDERATSKRGRPHKIAELDFLLEAVMWLNANDPGDAKGLVDHLEKWCKRKGSPYKRDTLSRKVAEIIERHDAKWNESVLRNKAARTNYSE